MSVGSTIDYCFYEYLFHVPIFIVCTISLLVIIIRWKRSPRASLWAFLGFGLILFIGIIVPLMQVAAQYWISNSPEINQPLLRSLVAIIRSILYALSFLFLLIAVMAGQRNKCV